jgi:1-deoxy-D-xylulose-5-phosphate reductoisomerase
MGHIENENNCVQRIAVFGSTGSIGTQTLEIAEMSGGMIVPVFLSCAHNVDLLRSQIERFRPEAVSVAGEADAVALLREYPDLNVYHGEAGPSEAAAEVSFDIMVNALVGIAGLAPTLTFIGREDARGRRIALANKETLVTGGSLVMGAAADAGVEIVPVDSEHSAIYQCFAGNSGNRARRIILTASGGPFRGFDRAALMRVTLQQTLAHPNWSMGAKITVDSATMVNKAFEIIEAKWLFGLAPEQIEVVVHPQSIVHSLVEFEDGAMLAQLGIPDMKVPISYAFTVPVRKVTGAGFVDLKALGALTFEAPGQQAGRAINLAYEVLRASDRGYNSPAIVLNGANEALVARFLKEEIAFTDIVDTLERILESHVPSSAHSVDEIFEIDREARNC